MAGLGWTTTDFVNISQALDVPLTLAIRPQLNPLGTLRVAMATCASASAHRHSIGVSAANAAVATSNDGAASSSTSAATLSVDTDYFICGRFGAASRIVTLDETHATEETTARTPTGLDTISIGMRANSTPANAWSGPLGEAAAWNRQLSDAEVLMVKRFSPLAVLRGLVLYCRMLSAGDIGATLAAGDGFTRNWKGVPLTLTGTGLEKAAHFPMRYPKRVQISHAIPRLAVTHGGGDVSALIATGVLTQSVANRRRRRR